MTDGEGVRGKGTSGHGDGYYFPIENHSTIGSALGWMCSLENCK